MTNEERAALIAQGWTPPEAVDPDIAEAKKLSDEWGDDDEPTPEKMILRAIKMGRALAAETKPGLVWVKHDEADDSPVGLAQWVWTKGDEGITIRRCKASGWRFITHYAVITPPAEDAA